MFYSPVNKRFISLHLSGHDVRCRHGEEASVGRREPTCVRQVDDGHEHRSGGQRHGQEEQGLELLPGQPVLQVLQEGVDLEQHEHACGDTETAWKCSSRPPGGSKTQITGQTGSLTCCRHVFAGPDWLEADEGDLHGQDQADDVEGAVGCGERGAS